MPTVKQLTAAIRQINKHSCVRGYSSKKKATLVQIVSNLDNTKSSYKKPMSAGSGSGSFSSSSASKGTGKQKKKKMILPTLVSSSVGGSSSMGFGGGSSSGTKGQKSYKKGVNKISSAYAQLGGKDTNPDLAF